METRIIFKLRLNVEKWGNYIKGDTEEFTISLCNKKTGLVRYPIDERWDILSHEIVCVGPDTSNEECTLPVVNGRYYTSSEIAVLKEECYNDGYEDGQID